MDEEARAYLAELLWQMRKTPDVRASQIARAKKLIADPRYPSEEVLRKVADLLAKGFKHQDGE
jgi:hypothetical protein